MDALPKINFARDGDLLIFILRVSFAQLRQGQSEEGRCLGLAIQTASQRVPSFNSYEISGQVPNLRGTAHQDEQTSVSRPPLPNHPQVERASPRRLIQIGSYLLVSHRLFLMSSKVREKTHTGYKLLHLQSGDSRLSIETRGRHRASPSSQCGHTRMLRMRGTADRRHDRSVRCPP